MRPLRKNDASRTYAGIIDAMISLRLEYSVSYNRPPGTFQLCALQHPNTGNLTVDPTWWASLRIGPPAQGCRPSTRDPKPPTRKLFAKAVECPHCLIVPDWWYEWQRGSDKQADAIRPKAHEPFFFAGVRSKASRLPGDHAAAGQVTFAILTGEPNNDIGHIRNRQPQALTREAARVRLYPDETETDHPHRILADGRYTDYGSWPIAAAVGSPSNDYPEIIEPIATSGLFWVGRCL